MDIFVMPSYREGFGIVNIEAAAMELPVVSTRIPGCVDSVHDGVTGTLVPPRDANSLAAAIEKYIIDPLLREQHGQVGRQRAIDNFSPEQICKSLFQLYMDLAEDKNPVCLGGKKLQDTRLWMILKRALLRIVRHEPVARLARRPPGTRNSTIRSLTRSSDRRQSFLPVGDN
jgi:hypothetical protein